MCLASDMGLFNFRPNVCHIDSNAAYLELFQNISLHTCKQLCNGDFSPNCSGLFWNRLAGECWLTSYTGDYDNSTDCDREHTSLMFFRRHRVSCKWCLVSCDPKLIIFNNLNYYVLQTACLILAMLNDAETKCMV